MTEDGKQERLVHIAVYIPKFYFDRLLKIESLTGESRADILKPAIKAKINREFKKLQLVDETDSDIA